MIRINDDQTLNITITCNLKALNLMKKNLHHLCYCHCILFVNFSKYAFSVCLFMDVLTDKYMILAIHHARIDIPHGMRG